MPDALIVGPVRIDPPVFVAPMAGVTDEPYRRICRRFGAGIATAEMLTADTRLWHSAKSRHRRIARHEQSPRSVQIVGNEPAVMAEAARAAEAGGAQLIDINMGCPAKKVCNRAAGSALLRDPALVAQILQAVVGAVSVPVTLKTRTGWSTACRNGPDIALLAEDCGIALLAVHGRSRACRFNGDAEYDTIARIRQLVRIPVIANGDIDSAEKALRVLEHTRADGIMIGRGALGRPWLYGQVAAALAGRGIPPAPGNDEIARTMMDHLRALHAHYGEERGLRIARKHVGWYLQNHPLGATLRRDFNRLEAATAQLDFLGANLAGGWRAGAEAA